MKFHETLKGRWLSTRNILVTARLILAGDFWLMIQKKTRQNRECDDDFIGLRLRRARLPKLNCLCQRFSKWSSNFALALKPMFLHFCGFEHLSWLPKLNCLCQRFSKWSSNFGLALKPMFLHFCGFKHWSWLGSYTFVVSELQFASVLLFELNCLCQWFSYQSSSITNNFAKN